MAEQYTGAGVDQIILAGRGRDPNDYLERLSQMATELVEPAARLLPAGTPTGGRS